MMERASPAVRALLATLICSLLLGCGFQLRGLIQVPEALKRVYLQSPPASQVALPLERQLKANGIQLLEAQEADFQLVLLSERHDRRAASLTSRAKTEEYELRSQLNFTILDNQGEPLIEPQALLVERVYRFDENNINAKDAEEALLRREMYQDLARQVVRRYLSLAQESAAALQ